MKKIEKTEQVGKQRFKIDYRIDTYRVDQNKIGKPSGLWQVMQEAACSTAAVIQRSAGSRAGFDAGKSGYQHSGGSVFWGYRRSKFLAVSEQQGNVFEELWTLERWERNGFRIDPVESCGY